MRKVFAGLLLFCCALVLPTAALAAPVVTLKAKPVPIPKNPSNPHSGTWPGTGDILGAGAAVEASYKIEGTEYGGFPPPLRAVKFYLPKGVKLHQQGFATCSPQVLEQSGPEKCPKKSQASSVGEALGVVSFGTERVQEKAEIKGFFAPGGNLVFYVAGHSPVSLEFVSKGSISPASGPFGQVVNAEVPLVETVPGALAASALSFKVTVGAAYKKGKKLVSYGTVPKTCPKGGFPAKSELSFGAGPSPSEWVTSSAEYKVPCPPKKRH